MNTYLHEAFDHWHIVAGLTVAAIIIAASSYALAGKPAGQVPIVGGDTVHTTVVQALAVAPPLATALDICQDPTTRFAHFKLDDHFEADLIQNLGQLNQVSYHLFWRPDQRLQVIIEEARAGQRIEQRTDPHTTAFDDCVAKRKVEEVLPRN